MKKILIFLSFSSFLLFGFKPQNLKQQKPKLVVGIVIDQMRYDYLTRFADRYGEEGFKRLLNNGFSLENAHYNYIPTYTAVGHTSIYTGTTPDNHGIISNNWYDKFLKKSIYCVDDGNYKTIGNNSTAGKKSPFRMQTTTVTDQLHLAQNMKGKTIGIAIKDRSAILPAGHTANAAYWFHGKEKGHWVSSSFYMEKLPNWVTKFNNNDKARDYLKTPWNTLFDIETYTNSIADENIFEGKFIGETSTSFPHDIPNLKEKNGNFDIIKGIPAGNSFTADFAKAAIVNENLGKGAQTDFLAVSFSSTDYVGHQFGPTSVEIEDTYLRLDRDIADLLSFLDKQVGLDNYTVFLTADHAAVDIPAYLQSVKIPAHYFSTSKFRDAILKITVKYFNSTELIENVLYVFQYGISTGITRAFTAVPAHATFGILMGYFMGKAKFSKNKMKFNLIGLLIATFFHGAYDFFLFINFIPGTLIGAIISLIIGIVLANKAIKKHQKNSVFKS